MTDTQTHVRPAGPLTNLLFGSAATGGWLFDFALLGARLYAGVTIAGAGYDKLPTPDWMADQVAQVGFPAPGLFAIVACVTEFVAGILLALGLLTRPAAMLLAFTMGVASFGFHELPMLLRIHVALGLFWLFVAFIGAGAGRLSLDAIVRAAPAGVGRGIAAGVTAFALGAGAFFQLFGTTDEPADQGDAAPAIQTLSVAGSFNGWSLNETPMAETEPGVWTATFEVEQAGPVSLKFAANGSWDLNLGDADQSDDGMPASGAGEVGAGNITAYAPEPGSYRVTLRLDGYGYSVEPAPEATPEPAPE